jgi:hypothetical protein
MPPTAGLSCADKVITLEGEVHDGTNAPRHAAAD